jgi:hypothetical protein
MKTPNLRPGIQFTNAVAEAQKLGLTHDQAYNKVCRERPDLLRKMKRSPLIEPSRTLRNERIAAEFSNAALSDPQLDWTKFNASPPLRAAIGIVPGDSATSIGSKVATAATKLTGPLLTELWNMIVVCVSQTTGDMVTAAQTAAKLFPQLASDAGFKA